MKVIGIYTWCTGVSRRASFGAMQREAAVVRFLGVGLVFVVLCGAAVLLTDPLPLHAWMNGWHGPATDLFFRNITHVADGLVPTALAILLLWKDYRSFLMMGLSCGVSALIAQFLKRMVFADHDRPAMFKDQLGELPWVSGVELNHHFSFPSGHSTAAWAMCFALTVILARRSWGVPLALLASLLAYSRVYLSQHFTEDILLGTIIGTVVAWAIYQWLYRSRFSARPWLLRRPGRSEPVPHTHR
jgi:membrane-associated phospholipid phosphatase